MQNTSPEQASVISFKYNNGQDATILVSKNAGRYRIQSSTSFEAMWLITQDLTERLTSRFAGT
jgi:Bardet-Biedl syndrome 9 protein